MQNIHVTCFLYILKSLKVQFTFDITTWENLAGESTAAIESIYKM